jgi:hypothetical protein
MKTQHAPLLFLVLFALLSFQSVSVEGKKKLDKTTTSTEETTDEEAAIELNPDYVEPVENEDADEAASEDDDDDVDDEIEDTSSVQGQIAAALHKTKKTSRTAVKLAKKYRSRITLFLTVFAFRREIRKTMVHLAMTNQFQMVDPKTGKVRINPTAILKVLLFVNFMRRLQESGGGGVGVGTFVNSNTTLSALLSVLGQSNPVFGALFLLNTESIDQKLTCLKQRNVLCTCAFVKI